MFVFLAQTTVETVIDNSWTGVMEGAAKWGLGIVLAVLLMALLFLIIKKILNNIDNERTAHLEESKSSRELFLKLLDQKDVTINNHLDHLTMALTELKDSQLKLNQLLISVQEIYSKENKNNTENIVNAIRNQTDLFIRLFDNNKRGAN